MEKAYRSMRNSGAAAIAVGITILIVGIAAGVVSIICGSSLLKNKNGITF